MAKRLKILSYGGGLDSFTMLVDGIQRGELPDWCVFSDTGSGGPGAWSTDGEWPSTYRHMVEYGIPLCEQYGIKFKWITHEDSLVRGSPSLFQYFEKLRIVPNTRERYCSEAAKIQRIEDWLLQTFGDVPMEVWIGFGKDEEDRIDKDPHSNKTCGNMGEGIGKLKKRINRFPLKERELCRCRCELLVRRSTLWPGGFPVPRKSACWFCPYGRRGDWQRLARELPEQFERAAQLEDNQKGGKEGQRYAFNSYQREKKMIFRPLREDILVPFRPQEKACGTCGRNPRASKVVGADYLQPDEYVAEEEPGEWRLGQAPPAVVEAPTAVSIAITNLTEHNLSVWLTGQVESYIERGRLVLPLDAVHVEEALAWFEYYMGMSQIDLDRDFEVWKVAAELQERLIAAVDEMDLPRF